jgi:hypothetical protein
MVILTRGSLSYLINFLLMKLVDALERINVSIFIVVDLLHFITIGDKIQGVGFKDKLGPFNLHDASRSNLMVPILISQIIKMKGVDKLSMLHFFLCIVTSNVTWFFIVQT